jgi:CubicO group peptidase (beta-lactamase class C family)
MSGGGTVCSDPDSRFVEIRRLFESNLASGDDLGASFAATTDGELVVDLWGGWADDARTRPWQQDTIVNVYSITKTMTALVALILADRGELNYAAPVAHYWPEFAANGKADVTVGHLVSHSAGLSGWRAPISIEDLYDWDKATSLLAAQAPFWKPGSAPGYHGYTFGYLVGEVVRRITGQSLGTFFRREIAAPLDADFHIGLEPEHDPRVADLIPPERPSVDAGSPNPLMENMIHNPGTTPLTTRTRAWRAAEIPAAGGHGHARSVVQVQTILANGGVAAGKRFLSEAGCRRALEPQIVGTDLVLGIPAAYGLGFGLNPMISLPGRNCLFWGGAGGSLVIIDMDRRATCAFVMNKMRPTTVGDERSFGLSAALWKAAIGT